MDRAGRVGNLGRTCLTEMATWRASMARVAPIALKIPPEMRRAGTARGIRRKFLVGGRASTDR